MKLTTVLCVMMGAAMMAGCGSGGSGSGGGSGGTTSTGGSGGATSTGGSGGTATGGSGGGSPCEAAVKAAGDKCAAEATRKCFFDEYGKLCATENATAITAAVKCFTTDVCHTFSDAGEDVVKTCLEGVYTVQGTTASQDVGGAYCGKCQSNTLCPSDAASGVPFSTLSDATLAEIKTCLDSAATCEAADACVAASLPGIAACF